MSQETDRVPVPTNGRGPHRAPPAGLAATPPAPPATPPASSSASRPTATDPRLVVSPTQLAVGFGVLASLILLLAGRRRRRGGGA